MDSVSANIAGFFSLGVALFPTNAGKSGLCREDIVPFIEISCHSIIHFSCAALFFLTLSFISVFLFTKSKYVKKNQTSRKRTRNWVYVACGCSMDLCIFIIGIYILWLKGDSENQIGFCLETIALLSFGLSWLTKGEALLKDQGETVPFQKTGGILRNKKIIESIN